MLKKLIQHIATTLNENILRHSAVQGGDISSAYLLQGTKKNYFLKVNHGIDALEMFEYEQRGLDLIQSTKAINTPQIYGVGQYEQAGYLLMQYLPSTSADKQSMHRLGEQLAQLHQYSNQQFGEQYDNRIGSLHQSNTFHADWTTFYIVERIQPQLQLALQNNYLQPSDIPDYSIMHQRCKHIFGNPTPALLHGDLWSGNYLIANDGTPYLIDPAVYYGHHLVDIAMARLFGGFSNDFYDAYEHYFPRSSTYKACMDLYQLYYLLVHLNLFGPSYYASVKKIMNYYWA